MGKFQNLRQTEVIVVQRGRSLPYVLELAMLQRGKLFPILSSCCLDYSDKRTTVATVSPKKKKEKLLEN